jgi:hypothetical protein
MISRTTGPVAVLARLLCVTTASAQDNRGTPEQRAACAPDAFRLCLRFIPDPAGVEACLRQSLPDLSLACRAIFEQATGRVAATGK